VLPVFFLLVTLPSVVCGQAQSGRDANPLAHLVTWVTTGSSANDSFVVNMPPGLDSAIQRVAPGFRLRTMAEFGNSFMYGVMRQTQNHSDAAVAADLDGDGKLEAVLWGVLKGRDSLVANNERNSERWQGLIQKGVIVGVRQSAAGFLVTKLFEGDDNLSADGAGKPRTTMLSLRDVLLLPSGKEPPTKQKAGLIHWIRWQDVDCQFSGQQWTVRNKAWIHSVSHCLSDD
jgi:hypothetical protein